MFRQDELPLSQLLFDPNNYRFQDRDDWVRADSSRYAEESVQQRAYQRIRPEGVSELKRSIITNGFLPIERLVVAKHTDRSGEALYVVLEGNRRLAALKWIQDDHEAGVEVPGEVLQVLSQVPVIVVDEGDESVHASLMGIRHVGGIKQWDGYQRAKLVTELKDLHKLSSNDVADRLGMTVHEVNRRFRAFKALEQMLNDEEYSELAKSKMYPIFHEAVSVPQIRDWLGWDEQKNRFANIEELHQFYDLIVGHHSEDAEGEIELMTPKITSYSQVRELKTILKHQDAAQSLLDPDQTWGDALGLAKADDLNRTWRRQVAEAIKSVSGISAKALSKLDDTEVEVIRELESAAREALDLHRKLRQQ